MKETARQPAGDMASNLTPPITTDRPGETISYLKTKIFTRWVTGILSTVIFGCAQTLSYLHTLHLFERHGYTGWQAHLGVIMFEALFFLGAFVTTVFHFIGTQPGIPVRVATLLGASFVAWSNISYGWEFGRGGVAIGIAIILCALVAEAVVGKAILHTGQKTSTTKLENQVERVEKSTHECGEVEKHSPATLEMEDGDVENPSHNVGKRESSSTLEVEGVEPASMSPPSTSTSETGESSTIVYSPGDDPLEIALEIMKMENRRPGRPRLMKAGMSEHTAKMTANKLKKLEQKAS
ncbi:hypothetical protein [Paludifilum halophilum]|uniref:Uncharacterized protein n=1 Tax=Paludifilum halophilum TaxID=1642702 RepID=A0A235B1S7_9BACL|nr:hypothetical protein [Paludifilum halophilum]OYD06260.1 hypothetical protein CHM34_16985 [Paludifilum halophilum]